MTGISIHRFPEVGTIGHILVTAPFFQRELVKKRSDKRKRLQKNVMPIKSELKTNNHLLDLLFIQPLSRILGNRLLMLSFEDLLILGFSCILISLVH